MNKNHIFVSDDTTIKAVCGNKRYCLHIQRDDNVESPREWDNITVMACFHSRYNLGDSGIAKEPIQFWHDLVSNHVSNDELVAAILAGKLQGIRIVEKPNGLVDVYETTAISILGRASESSEALEYEEINRGAVKDYVLDDLNFGQSQTLMKPHAEWLPLWLYDHSGLTISCGERVYPYNDRWDSGQVGWIVALKDTMMKDACEILRGENGEPIMEEHQHPDGSVTYSAKHKPLTEETWRKRAIEIMESDVAVYDQFLRGEVYGFTLYTADVPEENDEEDGDEDLDWEEEDSCWGFYGDDLLENGILEELPDEFLNAIRDSNFEEGTAIRHTRSYYEF